jgi:hypothetical protein
MTFSDSQLDELLKFLRQHTSKLTYQSTNEEQLEPIFEQLASEPSKKLAEVYFLTLAIAVYKFVHQTPDFPQPIDETNFQMGNGPDRYEETGTIRNWVSLDYIHPDKKYHIFNGSLSEKPEDAVRTFFEALKKLATEWMSGQQTV